jgi:hypothetical protein
VPADALLEEGLPGHEVKAEPVVDHGEAPADKAGDASEAATDILAGIRWHVGQAAVSRHLLADSINLPSFKSRQGVDRNADVAILGGRQPHVRQPLRPASNGFFDLFAKTGVPDFRAVVGNSQKCST